MSPILAGPSGGSSFTPSIKVEVAFGYAPDAASPVFTDISAYVLQSEQVQITRGRADEFSTVQPSTASFVLDNSDGRFTPGLTTSPYYPNVLLSTRLRITVYDSSGTGVQRFDGYVDEWPVQWAPTGRWSQAQVSATDRAKRLGRVGVFSNPISEEIGSNAPSAYYPLGEPAGAVAAGDVASFGQPALGVTQLGGTGGTLTFGSGTGSGFDGLTAAVFAPVSSTQGKYLAATLSNPVAFNSGISLHAVFLSSSATAQTLLKAGTTNNGTYFKLSLDSSGHVVATAFYSNFGTPVTRTATSSASFTDGLTHEAWLTHDGNTMFLYVDGALVGSDTAPPLYPFGYGTPSLVSVVAGGGPSGSLFTGTLSHVALFASAVAAARVADSWFGISQGFNGESSDARIARFARWAGLSSTSLGAGLSTSIAPFDTTGLAPLDAMNAIADTESGLVFLDQTGALVFQARSHRYNQSPVLTVDEIGTGDGFVMNDAQLVNDVTATRTGGVSARGVNAVSVSQYGYYRRQVTLLTTSDAEVYDAANWQANYRATPAPRLPSLTIDMATSTTLRDGALGLHLSDRFTLTSLPTQAPAASLDLIVEGWTETLSQSEWSLSLNTSPASQSGVWQLDSTTYSVLDSSTTLAY